MTVVVRSTNLRFLPRDREKIIESLSAHRMIECEPVHPPPGGNGLIFHVPSAPLIRVLDKARDTHQVVRVRFNGIIMRLRPNSGSYRLDGFYQSTSVDHFSHPHFGSFTRGDPDLQWSNMCTGGFRALIDAALAAGEYDVMAGLVLQCANTINPRSLNSSLPVLYECSNCGTTSLQNNIRRTFSKSLVCSHCPYVFIDVFPFVDDENSTRTGFQIKGPKVPPIWGDPWNREDKDAFLSKHDPAL